MGIITHCNSGHTYEGVGECPQCSPGVVQPEPVKMCRVPDSKRSNLELIEYGNGGTPQDPGPVSVPRVGVSKLYREFFVSQTGCFRGNEQANPMEWTAIPEADAVHIFKKVYVDDTYNVVIYAWQNKMTKKSFFEELEKRKAAGETVTEQ